MSPEQSKDRKRSDQPEKPKSIPDTAQEPDAKNADLLQSNFPVVALGASAGGLEAFTQFLNKLPEKIRTLIRRKPLLIERAAERQ